ncbi:poly(hydroxyalkanoate) granule-associated protein [Pseudoxanthomonas sp. 3HH-4]|uniref:phasin family protein n=1 Tax=Pseudoxanthomonas sp. 3HH-4 TaxID=1690214 RepID=UPI001153A3AD|nr:phasin family protein [Pseudoxanthomonas sp. 3HH-4]TQM12340.1 poly(hydroxyalkanoate) granule-associated protein [Pseudoxanthomonas sp. 3HH-4]
MATLKKSARKKTASASASKNDNLQAQAEQMSKRLGESAQQVWLAGVGAFGRAQAEGTKLFETLVKEGLSLEQTTRKVAGGKAQAMRDAMETTVGQARERASDTWDRLEKVFEERVHRALRRLEVPSREDLSALIDRVDALNAQLRTMGGASATKPSRAKRSTKPAVKKPAPAAKKTPAKRAARKKAAP